MKLSKSIKARKIAYQVKEFATKPDAPLPIPRILMVGETHFTQIILCLSHSHAHAYVHMHAHACAHTLK